MALLQVHQAKALNMHGGGPDPDVLQELRSATDLALRATKATAQALGQAIATLVVQERHLWLNLVEMHEAGKNRFLDAPASQIGLFGDAVEDFAQQFSVVEKQTEAISHMMPRRRPAATGPAPSARRGRPPAKKPAPALPQPGPSSQPQRRAPRRRRTPPVSRTPPGPGRLPSVPETADPEPKILASEVVRPLRPPVEGREENPLFFHVSTPPDGGCDAHILINRAISFASGSPGPQMPFSRQSAFRSQQSRYTGRGDPAFRLPTTVPRPAGSDESRGRQHQTSSSVTNPPPAGCAEQDLQVETQQRVNEGDSVTLTCKSTCSLTEETTFIWSRNTQTVTKGRVTVNQLQLQSVRRDDTGDYRCAVRGKEHLSSPEVYLDVTCENTLIHIDECIKNLNLETLLFILSLQSYSISNFNSSHSGPVLL
ncbi:uncharacterized protein LOC127652047 [Xyrauchen texanus]|uniref:uncharacterized protein LOC127652047 n=1 Tax=Xyrauchen texanus TaxID=154827 RepID=UPI002241DC1D|nr:uncharacterized protein LOC127652047 [Xyrauchen texanus]